jgi:hypothetical protein
MGGHPTKIGKYDVAGVIGRGGMGVVYKAVDPQIGRFVAIKMITAGSSGDQDLLRRFYREAHSTGSLQNPNIVTVFDLGEQDGNPYLVMEYLEGTSLESVLSSRRPLSLIAKLKIILDVCHGLSYAHQRAVIHRDIKPANIMVSNDGMVKIVDFGIAHIGDKGMTRTGQVVGSLSFMSPEQLEGKTIDARTDIFSTGVVLYELITNNLPFEGESTAATLMKIIHEPPPPLKNFLTNYPPELETIIMRSLAKNRDERYASADDFAFDVGQLLEQVKHEAVVEHWQQAETLFAHGELFKAKDQLVQLLKIDRQNTKATHLLREIQQRLKGAELMERVQKLRLQAEEAFAQQRFDSALSDLDLALKIDNDSPTLLQLREKVAEAHLRAQKLENALKAAELAHHQGQLATAKQAVEEALSLAPDNTRARALNRVISGDWEAYSRQVQVENLLHEAQKQMHLRKFTSAIEILRQAEVLDPAAPQILALMQSLVEKREQAHLQTEAAGLAHEIEEVLNRGDYTAAGQKADAALQRFPEDPGLVNLLATAEKQREMGARRQFIEDNLAAARRLQAEGRTQDLVSLLEGALARIGDEPRLRSLLLMARENVDRSGGTGPWQKGSATEEPASTAEYDSATQLFSGPGSTAPRRTGPRAAPIYAPGRPTGTDQQRPVSPPLVTPPARTDAKATNRMPLFIGVGALSLVAVLMVVWTSTRQRAKTAHSALVSVEIVTTPQGASVRVKGTNQECTTPRCRLNLAPGTYEVEAQLSGFETTDQTITVNSAGPNSVEMALNELPAPSRGETPLSSNHGNGDGPVSPPPARLQINRASAGAEILIDGETRGRVRGDGLFSTDVLPGDHKIKLRSGQGESATITQHFSSGNTLSLKGTDFASVAPVLPAEEADWQRVKNSQTIEAINQFLRTYPTGAFRSEAENKLEDLYWEKDNSADNPAALRDYMRRYPGGKHLPAANTGLARLDWQAIANTKDPAALENYLRLYSSGEYHDKAYSRLDDLLWERTGRGDDAGSLRSYLQTFPTGRHADQARREMDQLTAPKEAANANQPNRSAEPPRSTPLPASGTTTSLTATDDKTAVLNVLSAYEKFYESEDLQGLQGLWPSMTPQQIQSVGDFFKNASSVKLTCIPGSPKIGGTEATLEFKQEFTYVMHGTFQKPNRSKVNMKLKKAPQGTWLIDSIH